MNESMTTKIRRLDITSPAFEHGGMIPVKYSCDGEKVSPPLHIAHVPDHTVSLVLIAEDPDTPKGTFDHWLVWNIKPAPVIKENENPGISGINSAGETGYHPPCPPDGKHRYYFYIYALDVLLDLQTDARKPELQRAMKRHILAKGELMGYYRRIENKSKNM